METPVACPCVMIDNACIHLDQTSEWVREVGWRAPSTSVIIQETQAGAGAPLQALQTACELAEAERGRPVPPAGVRRLRPVPKISPAPVATRGAVCAPMSR